MLLLPAVLLLFASAVLAPNVYEVIRPIGEGTFGKVNLAKDKTLKRKVAIKCLKQQDGPSKTALDREFAIQQSVFNWLVDHDHITQRLVALQTKFVKDDKKSEDDARNLAWFKVQKLVPVVRAIELIDMTGDKHCAVMEYCEPGSMHDRIQSIKDKKSALPTLSEVALAFRPLAQALAVMHVHGLAHRDIKPANILMVKGGTAKWTDFGLACWVHTVSADGVPQCNGESVGTKGYKAHELYQDPMPFDPRSADVFALGIAFWEFICGDFGPGKYQDIYTAPPVSCATMNGSQLAKELYEGMTKPNSAERFTADHVASHQFFA